MHKEDLLHKTTWAVVGANQDPAKFGNRIYHRLKEHGYTVFAVNPRYDTIDGDPCYPSLTALPQKPDVIDMVVAPHVGLPVLEEAASLGIEYVWLQPGTYDDAIMERIGQLGLKAVKACVLLELP